MSVDRIQIILNLRILPRQIQRNKTLSTLSMALGNLQIVHEAL